MPRRAHTSACGLVQVPYSSFSCQAPLFWQHCDDQRPDHFLKAAGHPARPISMTKNQLTQTTLVGLGTVA
jgi:hypothetical protein